MLTNRPRGTNDFLPEQTREWHYVEEILRELCKEFGYEEIRTPIFEDTELFHRGVGDTTDIVQKEMYTFEDMGGRSVTLRPEGTAAAVRAYVENKLYAGTQPTKLYYMGPMFRYERPQAGRYRQFHQFGVECFGAKSPAADAEVIGIAWEFYRRIGLKNLEVHLNSVGCPNCRPLHKKQLQKFLASKLEKLCPTCQGRYEKNPLRILDCKSPICGELTEGAPTTLDCLCDDCKEHFELTKKYLEAAGIPYMIDNRLVRGLDYYTNTAFEIILQGIGAQSAICGGGRYDGLIEQIGGASTPGVGFALGMERIFTSLASQDIKLPAENSMDVYLAALGKQADIEAFKIMMELRRLGIKAEKDTLSRSLKAQMKYGDKFNVKYTLILGENELAAGEIICRDMADSTQKAVPIQDITAYLADLLK
ncbi:MAG: histidine--tRNA ligase [Clostridia bacterium]|nr:histidine--tRNA ligase [Clostridia bacterium]